MYICIVESVEHELQQAKAPPRNNRRGAQWPRGDVCRHWGSLLQAP